MTRTFILFLLFAMCLAASDVYAMQHEATADKGKKLFNDPNLGTNGKTCNDCHKDGAGVEKAADRKDLENMVNGCITVNLKGKPLKPKSVEMQSLLLYIRSIGGTKKQPEKKGHTGC